MAMDKEMPEDVLNLILCRLPVKSLLRFKSVSKNWFSLIQNPSFISLHQKYCSQTKESLLVKRFLKPDSKCAFSLVPANDTPILNLDIPLARPRVSDFNLIGSSNGLVCLSSEFEIMLCNPATREFRVLPQPPYHTCTLIFLGFAFDPKNNDYKVVRVAAPYETRPMTSTIGDEKVQIYHVSTDSWREIDAMVPEGYQPVYRLLCSLNGVFYWVVVDDNFVQKIIAFHMFDELFEQEFLPEDERISFTSSLSILRDSLALVTLDFSASSFNMSLLCSGTRLHIWLRDGKGVEDSWSKTYRVGLGPNFGCCYYALGFLQNYELLLLRCYDGQMVSYNPDTQTVKEYHEVFNHPTISHSEFQVLSYVENLVSVKRRVY